MVENKVLQIIYTNLKNYIEVNDVLFHYDNGLQKYTFKIYNYCFEIFYDFIDKFYRIRLEKEYHNQIQSSNFLTKSKKFHNDVASMLKTLNLTDKKFENHIYAFTRYVSLHVQTYKDLNCFDKAYNCDLKFDGIFVR